MVKVFLFLFISYICECQEISQITITETMEEENKTPFEEKIDQVQDKVEDIMDKVQDKVDEFVDKVEDKFDEKKAEWEDNKDEREAKKEEFKEKAEEAKEKVAEALKTEDETADYDPADIQNNKVMAILAYLGILVLIPIFAAKDSKFARFHSNQGLILFICFLICGVLSAIPVINLFAWIIYVLLFIFLIMGVINAGSGKVKRLPFIGKFDLIK